MNRVLLHWFVLKQTSDVLLDARREKHRELGCLRIRVIRNDIQHLTPAHVLRGQATKEYSGVGHGFCLCAACEPSCLLSQKVNVSGI